MKHLITVVILACWSLGITASQAADMHMHMHDGPSVPSQYGKQFGVFASEMNAGMAKMMSDMHAPGYTGDPDIDFLAMMIPHHEGAVDMARLVLQHGTDLSHANWRRKLSPASAWKSRACSGGLTISGTARAALTPEDILR